MQSKTPAPVASRNSFTITVVIFNVDERKGTGAEIEDQLRREGVLCLAFDKQKIRLVTHRDLTDNDIDNAIQAFQKVLG